MSNLDDEVTKYSFSDQKRKPTNMAITTSQNTKKMFESSNNLPFLSNIEPNNNGSGYHTINPSVYHNKYSDGFQFEDSPQDQKSSGSMAVYSSKDPRLKLVTSGGEYLMLDKPPLESKVRMNDMYLDNNLNRYGQNYETYSDINCGDIIYYINKEKQGPFKSSVFSTSARTTGVLYKDPMGSVKPIYERTPLKKTNPCSTKDFYEGGLSWIQDSQAHREDLLSKQMIKINQEKWEARWQV